MSRPHYYTLNDKRSLVIPGDEAETLRFALEHWITCAENAIAAHGAFYVALSGGSTPKALYQMLTMPANRARVNWSRVHLFWGDERMAPLDSLESNYFMAMQTSLLDLVPEAQIHPMIAQEPLDLNASVYEKKIAEILGSHSFDLIMLGMGEDGHTASLFPHTAALEEKSRLVIANEIPQKKTWRLTLTFPCINRAENIAFYVIGSSKKEMLDKVLFNPLAHLPAQKIGAPHHKALWIADSAASELISGKLNSTQ
jgi:6-phosphogluconolactonase